MVKNCDEGLENAVRCPQAHTDLPYLPITDLGEGPG